MVINLKLYHSKILRLRSMCVKTKGVSKFQPKYYHTKLFTKLFEKLKLFAGESIVAEAGLRLAMSLKMNQGSCS
jgi:hypothetical protein